jgi:hypothetical protein
MPETKAEMNQLFKKGNDFELRETDYSDKKKTEEIQSLNNFRDEVRKSADVDLNKLKTTTFRI